LKDTSLPPASCAVASFEELCVSLLLRPRAQALARAVRLSLRRWGGWRLSCSCATNPCKRGCRPNQNAVLSWPAFASSVSRITLHIHFNPCKYHSVITVLHSFALLCQAFFSVESQSFFSDAYSERVIYTFYSFKSDNLFDSIDCPCSVCNR
jgi:hypothetical protein